MSDKHPSPFGNEPEQKNRLSLAFNRAANRVQKAVFRIRLSRLEKGKSVDDAIFAKVVQTAVNKFGVEEDTFRDAFTLTKGAVGRWTQGQSLPQPSVRKLSAGSGRT